MGGYPATQCVMPNAIPDSCLTFSGPREAVERISDVIAKQPQALSDVEHLPPRLAVLDLSKTAKTLGDAPVLSVESSAQSSFCTVAPLSFCKVSRLYYSLGLASAG